MKNTIFCLIILIFANISLTAQINNKDNSSPRIGKDSIDEYERYFDTLPSPIHISLDVGYGYDIASSKAIFGNFNNSGSWNLFLNVGNFKTKNFEYYEESTGLKHYFLAALGLQFSNSTTKLSLSKPGDEKITMSVFRTNPKIIVAQGFGNEDFKVVPYVALPFFGFYTPNRIAYKNIPVNLNTDDRNFLNNYIDRVNFGCYRESGVMFHLNRIYNLYLSYENLIAYPRLLMGKDIGMTFIDVMSWTLIYAGTINLLSPKVGTEFKPTLLTTVVNFVLQNAYMVTTQYLRRDNMNWPFSSSKSLMLQTFRLNFGYIL